MVLGKSGITRLDNRVLVGVACGLVLLLTSWLGLGCRRVRLSAAEKDKLRNAIRRESEEQVASQERRDSAWEELRRRFDKDNNGSLSPVEEAAFNRHLEKIKLGKEPNPFPD